MMLGMCGSLVLLAICAMVGPIMLVVGLVGQRSPSRPRCASCRHALVGQATIPAACPGCRTALSSVRAVRFGGWKPRWRPLVGGLALTLFGAGLIGMSVFASTRLTTGVRVVNGITIENRITQQEFERRLALLEHDSGADAKGVADQWEWLRVHLLHAEWDDEMKQRGTEAIVGSLSISHHPERVANITALGAQVASGAYDQKAFAAAVLDAMVGTPAEPELGPVQVAIDASVATLDGGERREIRIHDSAAYALFPFAADPLDVAVVVTEVRRGGLALEPARPTGRVRTPGISFDGRFTDRRAAEVSTDVDQVEVDLHWAIFATLPPGHARGLPGPPDSWPPALAERSVTVVLPLR